MLYLRATGIMCTLGEVDPRCDPACATSSTHRRRRSTGIKGNYLHVLKGPIMTSRRNVQISYEGDI